MYVTTITSSISNNNNESNDLVAILIFLFKMLKYNKSGSRSHSSSSDDSAYAENMYTDADTKNGNRDNEMATTQFTKNRQASQSSSSEDNTYAESMFTDADTKYRDDKTAITEFTKIQASQSSSSDDNTYAESMFTEDVDTRNGDRDEETAFTQFTNQSCHSSSSDEDVTFDESVFTNETDNQKKADEEAIRAKNAASRKDRIRKVKSELDNYEEETLSTSSTFSERPLCYRFCGCGPADILPAKEVNVHSKLSTGLVLVKSDISDSSSDMSNFQESLQDGYQLIKDKGVGKHPLNAIEFSDSNESPESEWNQNPLNLEVKRDGDEEDTKSVYKELPQGDALTKPERKLEESNMGTSTTAMEELGLDREFLKSFATESPSQQGTQDQPNNDEINTSTYNELPQDDALTIPERNLEESNVSTTSTRAMEERGLERDLFTSFLSTESPSQRRQQSERNDSIENNSYTIHERDDFKTSSLKRCNADESEYSHQPKIDTHLSRKEDKVDSLREEQRGCSVVEPLGGTFRVIGKYLGRLICHDEEEDLALIARQESQLAKTKLADTASSRRDFSHPINDTSPLSIDVKSNDQNETQKVGEEHLKMALTTSDKISPARAKAVDEKYFSFHDEKDAEPHVLETDSLFNQSTISLGYEGELLLTSQNRSQVFRAPHEYMSANETDSPKDNLIDFWKAIENVNESYISSSSGDNEESADSETFEKTNLAHLDEEYGEKHDYLDTTNKDSNLRIQIDDRSTMYSPRRDHSLQTIEVPNVIMPIEDTRDFVIQQENGSFSVSNHGFISDDNGIDCDNHNASLHDSQQARLQSTNKTSFPDASSKIMDRGMSIDLRDIVIEQEMEDVADEESTFISDDDEDDSIGDVSLQGSQQGRLQSTNESVFSDATSKIMNRDMAIDIIEQEMEDMTNEEGGCISDDDNDDEDNDNDNDDEDGSIGYESFQGSQQGRLRSRNESVYSDATSKIMDRDILIDLRDIVIEQEMDVTNEESGFISDDDDNEDNDNDEDDSIGDASLQGSQHGRLQSSHIAVYSDESLKIMSQDVTVDLRNIVIEEEMEDVANEESGFIPDDDSIGDASLQGSQQGRLQSSHAAVYPDATLKIMDQDMTIDLRDVIIEQGMIDVADEEGTFISDDDDDDDDDDSISNVSLQEGPLQYSHVAVYSDATSKVMDRHVTIDLRDVIIEQEMEDMANEESGFISDDDIDDEDDSIGNASLQGSPQGNLHSTNEAVYSDATSKVMDRDVTIDLRDFIIEQEMEDMANEESGFISDDDIDDEDDSIGNASLQGSPQGNLHSTNEAVNSDATSKVMDRDVTIDLGNLVMEQEMEDMADEESGFISDDDDDDDENDDNIGDESLQGSQQGRLQSTNEAVYSDATSKIMDRDMAIDRRDVIIEQEMEVVADEESGFISDDDDDESEPHLEIASTRTLYAGILIGSDQGTVELSNNTYGPIFFLEEGSKPYCGKSTSDEDNLDSRTLALSIGMAKSSSEVNFDDRSSSSTTYDSTAASSANMDCDEVQVSGFISPPSSFEDESDNDSVRTPGISYDQSSPQLSIATVSKRNKKDRCNERSIPDFDDHNMNTTESNRKKDNRKKERSLSDSNDHNINSGIEGKTLHTVKMEEMDCDEDPISGFFSPPSSFEGDSDDYSVHDTGIPKDKSLPQLNTGLESKRNQSVRKYANSIPDSKDTNINCNEDPVFNSFPPPLSCEDDSDNNFMFNPPKLSIAPEPTRKQIDRDYESSTADFNNHYINLMIEGKGLDIKVDETFGQNAVTKISRIEVPSKKDNAIVDAKVKIVLNADKVQSIPSDLSEKLSTISYGQNKDATRTTRSVESAKLRGTAGLVSAAHDLISRAQRHRSVKNELAEMFQKASSDDKEIVEEDFDARPGKSLAQEELTGLDRQSTSKDEATEERQLKNDGSFTDKELDLKVHNELAEIQHEDSRRGKETEEVEFQDSKKGSCNDDDLSALFKNSRDHFKARRERIAERRAIITKLREARGYNSDASVSSDVTQREDINGHEERGNAKADERVRSSPTPMSPQLSEIDHNVDRAGNTQPVSLTEGSQEISSVWLSGGNSKLQEKAKRRTMMFQKFRRQLNKAKGINSSNSDDDKELVS